MTQASVLIFGEGKDYYDSQAIEYLIRALAPSSVRLKLTKLRSPVILDRGAARRKRASVADEIAAHDRVRRRIAPPGERVVVVAFHDCDALEPAHIEQAARLEQELVQAGVERPVAATPAWCIEAWWMLFPEALATTRKCWKSFAVPANVGAVVQAKSALRRALRPQGHTRCPDYDERDSPTIARHVFERRLASDSRTNQSASLQYFRDRLRAALV